EPEPGPLTLSIIVLDRHCNHGSNPGEGIDHGGDDRPVAKADKIRHTNILSGGILPDDARRGDAVEEGTSLVRGEDRGLALGDDVPGAADRVCRVDVDDLA